MTKLRWDKVGEYHSDPGAAVAVPDLTRPERWVPPCEQARKQAEAAASAKQTKKNREMIAEWSIVDKLREYILTRRSDDFDLDPADRAVLQHWQELSEQLGIVAERRQQPKNA